MFSQAQRQSVNIQLGSNSSKRLFMRKKLPSYSKPFHTESIFINYKFDPNESELYKIFFVLFY